MNSRTSPSLEILESRIAPATLFALTETNGLLRFDSDSPGTIESSTAVTGLGAGESLRGIDFRPATSELLGFTVATASSANSVINTYRIDPETAVATLVGATAATLVGAADVPGGFDFNPTVDRLRYVNTNDENARLNPTNGALAGNDTDLTSAASVEVIGAAYDRNLVNVGLTTLFVVNRSGSQLAIEGGVDASPSPNSGVITNVGPLGITLSASADGGFDIEPITGTAYAALTNSANQTALYTINLTTGAATFVGLIGTGATPLRGLSAAPPEILTIVNDRTATYTDDDGDRVTIKVSEGTLDASDFGIAVTGDGRGQLRFVDFSDDGTEFDGADLSITAKKAPGGNGLVNVGLITARNTVTGIGVDLGTVTVQGDLVGIDAGDADGSDPALGKLSVRSLGRSGLAAIVGVDLTSDLNGAVGTLDVKGDVFEVHFAASGPDAAIGTVKIGGSLIGGSGNMSGRVFAQSGIGKVTIGGDIVGGSGLESGHIGANSIIGSIVVGGSIRGGSGSGSGAVSAPFGIVKIKGDLLGGAGIGSGLLESTGNIQAITIGGSVIGGTGSDTGQITGGGDIGTVKIGRDFIGGSVTGAESADRSGSIQALGRIGSISIGGSIVAGIDDSSGTLTSSAAIRANREIGSLTVKGNILGNATTGQVTKVTITAAGQATPGVTTDLAIGKITVGGRVERAQILAGYNLGLIPINGDASIGAVKVGQDWIASDLVAGVQDDADVPLDDFFGEDDDELIPGFAGGDRIARIASITIKGLVLGTSSPTDHFGFIAERIDSFSSLGGKPIVTADAVVVSPLTHDVTVRGF